MRENSCGGRPAASGTKQDGTCVVHASILGSISREIVYLSSEFYSPFLAIFLTVFSYLWQALLLTNVFSDVSIVLYDIHKLKRSSIVVP